MDRAALRPGEAAAAMFDGHAVEARRLNFERNVRRYVNSGPVFVAAPTRRMFEFIAGAFGIHPRDQAAWRFVRGDSREICSLPPGTPVLVYMPEWLRGSRDGAEFLAVAVARRLKVEPMGEPWSPHDQASERVAAAIFDDTFARLVESACERVAARSDRAVAEVFRSVGVAADANQRTHRVMLDHWRTIAAEASAWADEENRRRSRWPT